MANMSYLWQLINSMEDATKRLEKALSEDNQAEITRLKAFVFDIQQRVKQEVKQKNGK